MSWDPGPPLTRRERRALQEALRKDGARRMVRDIMQHTYRVCRSPWTALAVFAVFMVLLMSVAVVFAP